MGHFYDQSILQNCIQDFDTFSHCRWNLQQWCFQAGGSEFSAGDAFQSLGPTSPETIRIISHRVHKNHDSLLSESTCHIEALLPRENIWADDNANCYIAEQSMFKQLSKIALMSTFSIFHAYQTKEWVSPPLLKPWLILELACSWKWFTMQRLCLAYSSEPLLFIVTLTVLNKGVSSSCKLKPQLNSMASYNIRVVLKCWHLGGWRARVFTSWQDNQPCSSHSSLTMTNQTG